MKKKVLIIVTSAILTIGAATAVYAKGNNGLNNFGFRGTMMKQSSINSNTYSNMINLMKQNGFEAGAKAMQSRDFNAMSKFMSNITDEDYKKMIDIMNNNGYGAMAKLMGSVSRQGMVNVQNSMMGSVNRQGNSNVQNSMMESVNRQNISNVQNSMMGN